MAVAQINREVMQESLHVGTLPIPGGNTVDSKRVAQVVNPRLFACVSTADACALAKKSEFLFELYRMNGVTALPCEKGRLLWPSVLPSAIVLNQSPVQLWAHGNQPRLPKLRVPNSQDRPAQVHV